MTDVTSHALLQTIHQLLGSSIVDDSWIETSTGTIRRSNKGTDTGTYSQRILGSARQRQWKIYLFVLNHGTSPFRWPSVFSTNHRQSRFFQRSFISLLTGMETPQISPPSLAFNWMPIFVATDINWFFFEIVFANTIWKKKRSFSLSDQCRQ